GDGHEWTVSEDWEARTGLAHGIFQVTTSPVDSSTVDPTYASLRSRFHNEKVFVDVVDAIYELDQGKSLRDRNRARHKAHEYMIEEGKLWRVGSGNTSRAKARVECISQDEATKLAWEIHRNGGHFHRDNVKVQMLNTISSPKLDQSITKAIV
ncbi:hypothetical protein FA15DRAFT_556063, partial [Coprinopsis marcescibilis]